MRNSKRKIEKEIKLKTQKGLKLKIQLSDIQSAEQDLVPCL
jgi:hypothetical protein